MHMNKKKPFLEKVYPGFGSSVLVKKHTEFLKTNKASWHFHPELELETELQDSSKLDRIYTYINTNFKDHISLDQIANVANTTVPAFCRYFKKVTGKTFTKLVNEYRVVHATKLLSESMMSITDISFECGFNNFSHFNKIFKEITGKNASGYRKEMKDLIQ